MLLIAFAQTLSSALIAYGFAKFKFPLSKLLLILMIATFIIPEQVTLMPRYMLFKNYGMLNTILPFLLPSLTGQGIKSAIFILIFYRFFRMAPKAMDEAAMVDGAGFFRVFAVINIPPAIPGAVVVFIFSFVWHWNETYLSDLYFGTTIKTMPLLLQRFTEYFMKMFPVSATQNPMLRMNEGIRMAATIICIIPLILLYFAIERKLIESIDKTGITGE
jgi:multiple sugar transport system permease protein